MEYEKPAPPYKKWKDPYPQIVFWRWGWPSRSRADQLPVTCLATAHASRSIKKKKTKRSVNRFCSPLERSRKRHMHSLAMRLGFAGPGHQKEPHRKIHLNHTQTAALQESAQNHVKQGGCPHLLWLGSRIGLDGASGHCGEPATLSGPANTLGDTLAGGFQPLKPGVGDLWLGVLGCSTHV